MTTIQRPFWMSSPSTEALDAQAGKPKPNPYKLHRGGRAHPKPISTAEVYKGLERQIHNRENSVQAKKQRELDESNRLIQEERRAMEEEKRRQRALLLQKRQKLKQDLDNQVLEAKRAKQRERLTARKYHTLQQDSLATWQKEQEEFERKRKEDRVTRAQQWQRDLQRIEAQKRDKRRAQIEAERKELKQFDAMLERQEEQRKQFFRSMGNNATSRARAKHANMDAEMEHEFAEKKQKNRQREKDWTAGLQAQINARQQKLKAEREAEMAYARQLEREVQEAERKEYEKQRAERERNIKYKQLLRAQINARQKASVRGSHEVQTKLW